jgi:hypothetical protein
MTLPDDVNPDDVAAAKLEHDEREAKAIAEGERRMVERDRGRAELEARPARRIGGTQRYSRRQLARMDPGDED